jgi:hypothetical protein
MMKPVTFTCTRGEFQLLNYAIRCAIEYDKIEIMGLSRAEQFKLARVANRLSAMANMGEPYFESDELTEKTE